MIGWVMAAAAGIALGSRIVACIFDELSDEEIEKQAELRRKQEEFQQKYDKYQSELERFTKIELENMTKEAREKEYLLKCQHVSAMTADMNNLIAYYLDSAEARYQEKEKLYEEIKDTIQKIGELMKSQSSMLRRNSLNMLIRELEEAKEKTYAYYHVYLWQYINHLKTDQEKMPVKFEFTLPEDFFYTGKLIYLEKKTLLSQNAVEIPNWGYLNYSFDETEAIRDLSDDALVPLMCDLVVKKNYKTVRELSARKGYFKNLVVSDPKIGLSARVIGYDRKRNILLNYQDNINLILPRANLANAKQIPPIGARLRVYPIKWDYTLYRDVMVSERTLDSYLCYSFDDLPVVFSSEEWAVFSKVLKERKLMESRGDWKIAPFDETKISDAEFVKLQLDNELCFKAEIVRSDKDQLYFSFKGLLSKEYYVRPEDVFLGIDCTLNIFLDSDLKEISDSVLENMSNLVLMTLSEFKVQYQTKMSRNGMQYFNKWSETTDRLITYLQKGKSEDIEIRKVSEQRRRMISSYTIKVADPEQLKTFVDAAFEEAQNYQMVKFFFEIAPGLPCYISIKGDATEIFASGKTALMDEFFGSHKIITLYQKRLPYAEIQQASALNQFRVGKLENPLLQAYALNGANVCSEKQEVEISLFNRNIEADLSQRQSVQRALEEKNIYFIQGPPGTGKTTVIREILMQTLKFNPLSKILVVSQANVAVDNVLKGLLRQSDVQVDFLRCGHRDKINMNIEPHSFDHNYQSYVSKIRNKMDENPENALVQQWGKIVCTKDQYNPNVGELILKSYPVIGATCVGLAKKRIGLDRCVYDLVIIDEAGKALPAEILIPYIRGKKVILIGDHMQLPPTVNPALLDPDKIEIEDRSLYEDKLFGQSFFQRLYEAAPETNKSMLTTQYRMPPVIGSMVSKIFYDNRLVNGSNTFDKQSKYFGTSLTLVNTHRYREISNPGQSVTNPEEADLVIKLLRNIRSTCPETSKIAVITPYKGQKRLLLKEMMDSGYDLSNVDINTVDAFQGDEAEIVIFCCTRTRRMTNFFEDPRRLNVAFSRAKNELIILGSVSYFKHYGDKSVLPKIAEYIKQFGEILSVEEALADR